MTEQRADGRAPTRQGGFSILGRLPVHGGMTAVMTVAVTVTITVTTTVTIAAQGGFNILGRLPVFSPGAGLNATVLAGAVRWDQDRRPRNTLFAVRDGGVIAGMYDKWHLVPFGEYQPDWLPIGIQIVPGGGFARGPGPKTLHLPGIPAAGPLICYEAIFPGQVVDEADRPDWMVNATNDAWFGTSTGPRQHLAAVRLRAVEEGLPVLRAANTGITAGFDSKGHEMTRLDMEETGFRTLRLPGSRPPTLFSRFGLWIPFGLAVLALTTGLVMILKPRL